MRISPRRRFTTARNCPPFGGADSSTAHRFVIGARNSGAERSGGYILESLGIDYEDKFNLAYMGYGATVNAIQDGTIVGMNIPAGVPSCIALTVAPYRTALSWA